MQVTKEEKAQLIKQYEPLVQKMAWRYTHASGHYQRADIEQEARLALAQAIDTYDESKNTKMLTYLYSAVRYACIAFNRDNKYVTTVTKVDHKNMQLGISDISRDAETVSINVSDTNTESDRWLAIPSGDIGVPETLIKKEQEQLLANELDSLEGREQEVIVRRFYDGDTLATIAKDWGVTRQRVNQIEKRALGRLKSKVVPKIGEELLV